MCDSVSVVVFVGACTYVYERECVRVCVIVSVCVCMSAPERVWDC